ncbi:MAG: sensor domain-containing diguanylate cyclase [Burkholderiales bacterium]|nr:sensor domain-containing diguanylate cyclase [Burkholderiales bacterium]
METVASSVTYLPCHTSEAGIDVRAQQAVDLDELLSIVAEHVFDCPDVNGGAIHLFKSTEDALITSHIVLPEEFRAIQHSYQGFRYPLSRADINVSAFETAQHVIVTEDNVGQFGEATRLRFERMKMRSLLAAPLKVFRNDGSHDTIGVISMFSQNALLNASLARQIEALAAPYVPLIQVHWRLHMAIGRSAEVEAMHARLRQFIAGITEMNSRTALKEVFGLIGHEFIERFGFDLINLFLLEDNQLTTMHFALSDPYAHLAPTLQAFTTLNRYSLDLQDGQTPLVFRNNKLLQVHDALKILHLPMSDKDRSGLAVLETPRTFLLVPIRYRDEAIGVLWLVTLGEPLSLSETDLMLIELLASFISTAIRNAQAHGRVEQQKREIELLNHELNGKVTLLDQIARRDSLTGLNNFGNFEEELRRRISECSRTQAPAALSVILLDVDQFKQFNDTYGHPAGNQVLQEVATRILKCSREMDFVARYGGEEFAVLLPQCDLESASATAERIRHAIADQSFIIDGREHRISLSGGCAQLCAHENSREFVCRADKALYAAKHNGRNRIERSE